MKKLLVTVFVLWAVWCLATIWITAHFVLKYW